MGRCECDQAEKSSQDSPSVSSPTPTATATARAKLCAVSVHFLYNILHLPPFTTSGEIARCRRMGHFANLRACALQCQPRKISNPISCVFLLLLLRTLPTSTTTISTSTTTTATYVRSIAMCMWQKICTTSRFCRNDSTSVVEIFSRAKSCMYMYV